MKAFGAWILVLLIGSAEVFASAAQDPPDLNIEPMTRFFKRPVPVVSHPARHTFVFWVNGDADHFVTQSSSALAGAGDDEVRRVDAYDARRIEEVARSCSDCNVVILHDQRGSAHWYTANGPWAVWFKIFSRGELILERHADEVDGSDPRLLNGLVTFASVTFPKSELHLIYRGHSFREVYRPGSREITPFDYSHPENGYETDLFLQSLRGLIIPSKLASVTFASCSMASFELARQLSEHAQFLVASEVDVLEVLNVGFRFDVLKRVRDTHDARQVSWLLAHHLFDAFRTTKVEDDALFESPATWVDLTALPKTQVLFERVMRALESLPSQKRSEVLETSRLEAALVKGPSGRYAESLKRAGKNPIAIALILGALKVQALNPSDVDLGLWLQSLERREELLGVRAEISALRERLERFVRVIAPSPASPKSGLIFRSP